MWWLQMTKKELTANQEDFILDEAEEARAMLKVKELRRNKDDVKISSSKSII